MDGIWSTEYKVIWIREPGNVDLRVFVNGIATGVVFTRIRENFGTWTNQNVQPGHDLLGGLTQSKYEMEPVDLPLVSWKWIAACGVG